MAKGGLAAQAGGAGDGAIASMDAGTPLEAEAASDLAEHDRGADLAFGGMLVAGTSRLVRKTKNFVRHAFICFISTLPAGWATGACISRNSFRLALAA